MKKDDQAPRFQSTVPLPIEEERDLPTGSSLTPLPIVFGACAVCNTAQGSMVCSRCTKDTCTGARCGERDAADPEHPWVCSVCSGVASRCGGLVVLGEDGWWHLPNEPSEHLLTVVTWPPKPPRTGEEANERAFGRFVMRIPERIPTEHRIEKEGGSRREFSVTLTSSQAVNDDGARQLQEAVRQSVFVPFNNAQGGEHARLLRAEMEAKYHHVEKKLGLLGVSEDGPRPPDALLHPKDGDVLVFQVPERTLPGRARAFARDVEKRLRATLNIRVCVVVIPANTWMGTVLAGDEARAFSAMETRLRALEERVADLDDPLRPRRDDGGNRFGMSGTLVGLDPRTGSVPTEAYGGGGGSAVDASSQVPFGVGGSGGGSGAVMEHPPYVALPPGWEIPVSWQKLPKLSAEQAKGLHVAVLTRTVPSPRIYDILPLVREFCGLLDEVLRHASEMRVGRVGEFSVHVNEDASYLFAAIAFAADGVVDSLNRWLGIPAFVEEGGLPLTWPEDWKSLTLHLRVQ